MNKLFKKEKIVSLFSLCEGTLNKLEELEDGLFSENLLGNGCFFRCEKGEIYAPCDGMVASIIGTNHAIGIRGPSGVEVLIHIGLDSALINNKKCFILHVDLNQQISKGQLLISYSKETLKSLGYDDPVIMTVLNAADYKNVKEETAGYVTKNDVAIYISV